MQLSIHQEKVKFNTELLMSFAIVFTSTLHSIYFYQIKLAPFPVISFFLLLTTLKKINRTLLYLVLGFYAIFILNAFFGIVYAGSGYYFNSLLGIAIGPMYFICFYSKFKSNAAYLETAVYLTLLTHIIFFYIQFCSFHLLGVKINYLQMITGEESRVEGVGVLTDLIRSSGLCNEPASYSLFANLLSFYLITIQRKMNWVVILALVSCLLSFSVSGMAFAAMNVLYFNLFIVKGYRKLLLSVVGVGISLAILGFFYFDLLKLFFEARFIDAEEDASLNARFNNGFKYFFEQNIFMQTTGIGLGNYPKDDISTVASGYMAIFVHLGYLFTALFLALNFFFITILKYKWVLLLFFFLYLSSTMTFLNIHYWMFFAMGALASR